MLKCLKLAVPAGLAVWLLAACAGSAATRPQVPPGEISDSMLFEASPLAMGADLEDFSQQDILALTPEMRDFVDQRIKPHFGPKARLRQLTYALMDEGIFEIIYDEKTFTAEDTFEVRRGNCMSFTNLFVALARYAGLDARFQEVDVPPMWSFAGESFVINQHINVFIDLGYGSTRVIDFNINDFTTEFDSRIVSDRRARAHYFNNLGAEAMLGGDTVNALNYFRQSIWEDSSFSGSWINLGSLYRRDGYVDYAEAAYLRALRADESSLVAMSNLANLYRASGRNRLADLYAQEVREHRNRNPYYHYYLATDSFKTGDYALAIDHVRNAIRLRDDEPLFYSLLSVSYLMSGDRGQAVRWMEKAEAVAVEATEKDHYHDKIEALMSHNDGG